MVLCCLVCRGVGICECSSFDSEHTEISELLTLNICLIFWTYLVELAYCEPPPDTQWWCDGALLLRVRRRRFLWALFFWFWAHWNFQTPNFEYLFDFLNIFGRAGLLCKLTPAAASRRGAARLRPPTKASHPILEANQVGFRWDPRKAGANSYLTAVAYRATDENQKEEV